MTSSFNNGAAPGVTTTALYQDGHRGSSTEPARTFVVESQTGQSYNVRVYLDRVSYTGTAYDQIQVAVEGSTTQVVATTASLYSSLYFANATDTNHDGAIAVTIADLGGAHVLTDGHDIGPDETLGELGGGRDEDAPHRPSIPIGFNSHKETIMQELDRN